MIPDQQTTTTETIEASPELIAAAYARHERIVARRNAIQLSFLEQARDLYEFNEGEEFLLLGYTSFDAYVSDPEVDISPRMAHLLKGVWFTYYVDFVQRLHIVGDEDDPDFPADLEEYMSRLVAAGVSKLSLMRPYVDEMNVDEMLEQAATLSRSGLIRWLKSDDRLRFDAEEERRLGWRPRLTFREPADWQLVTALRFLVREILRFNPGSEGSVGVKTAVRVLQSQRTSSEEIVASWAAGELTDREAREKLGVDADVADAMLSTYRQEQEDTL